MKLMLRGENQNPGVGHIGVDAALAGTRCDAIVLEAHDVSALYAMLASDSEMQRARLRSVFGNWLCKFVP